MAQHVYPLPDVDPPDDADEGDAASGDAGLVARARQGDRAAFALLFDRHAPRVYALAYRIAGQEVEAEDITQEAFLRALHALPTLRHGATFGPWVARIATNWAWDVLRQRQCLPQADLSAAVVATHPDTDRWGAPEAMGLAAEDQRAVRLTLARLAPTHRAALVMREIGGLSYADMAATLGATTGSVEVLLFRARTRFRDEYRKVALGATVARSSAPPPLACRQLPRVVATLADREGGAEERATARAHARGCAVCAGALHTQARDRKILQGLPLVVPATLRDAVLTQAGPLLVSYASDAAALAAALGGGAAVDGAVGVGSGVGAVGVAASTPAAALGPPVLGVLAGSTAVKVAAVVVAGALVGGALVVAHRPPQHPPTVAARGAAAGPRGRRGAGNVVVRAARTVTPAAVTPAAVMPAAVTRSAAAGAGVPVVPTSSTPYRRGAGTVGRTPPVPGGTTPGRGMPRRPNPVTGTPMSATAVVGAVVSPVVGGPGRGRPPGSAGVTVTPLTVAATVVSLVTPTRRASAGGALAREATASASAVTSPSTATAPREGDGGGVIVPRARPPARPPPTGAPPRVAAPSLPPSRPVETATASPTTRARSAAAVSTVAPPTLRAVTPEPVPTLPSLTPHGTATTGWPGVPAVPTTRAVPTVPALPLMTAPISSPSAVPRGTISALPTLLALPTGSASLTMTLIESLRLPALPTISGVSTAPAAPTVTVPPVGLPRMTVPPVAAPTVVVPTLPTVTVVVPPVVVPTLPPVAVPTVSTVAVPTLPTVAVPTLPTVVLPTVVVPPVVLPTVVVPTVVVPTVAVPTVAVPTVAVPTVAVAVSPVRRHRT